MDSLRSLVKRLVPEGRAKRVPEDKSLNEVSSTVPGERSEPGTLGVSGLLARKETMTTEQTEAGQAIRSTHLLGLDLCPLHRKTPFGMTGVSMTQLSIARHYGGIIYNGDHYTYFSDTDELVRDDVLKWQRKQKRAKPNSGVTVAPTPGGA